MTETIASKPLDWKTASETLQEWRKGGCRNSLETVTIGKALLDKHASKLGDDLWDVHEQVCRAALDIGNVDLAKKHAKALQMKFPDSLRVELLCGLINEADGRTELALAKYEGIIKRDASFLPAHRRKAAVFKSQGNTAKAIDTLTTHLKVFMADYESWAELADLYLSRGEYSLAAFCYEELIVSNPRNFQYHRRYAEILFAQGGSDNYLLARKYFSEAAVLAPGDARSLYGILMASAALANSKGSISKDDNAKVGDFAAKSLVRVYKAQSSPTLSIVEKMITSMQQQGGPSESS
eukprot:Opistho-2@70973